MCYICTNIQPFESKKKKTKSRNGRNNDNWEFLQAEDVEDGTEVEETYGSTEKFLSEDDLSYDHLTMIIMMTFYIVSHI